MVLAGDHNRFSPEAPAVSRLARRFMQEGRRGSTNTYPSRCVEPTLEDVLDAIEYGVVVLDTQRRVLKHNDAARLLLGGDAIGRCWDALGFASRRESRVRNGYVVFLDDESERMGMAQAALAHQIRAPLTAAGLTLDGIELTSTESGQGERFGRIRDSLDAIEQHVKNALVFVRGELTERHHFTVRELMDAMRDAWTPLLAAARVEWRERIRPHDEITGDLPTLVSALTNVIENSLAICGADMVLLIEVVTNDDREVIIRVTDDGPGMSEALCNQAHHAYVSARPGGTGLGLAILDAVVRAHEGLLSIESTPGVGTSVEVTLPLAASGGDA